MFTMAKIRDGSTYLGNHLAKNDYWSRGEKPVVGEWVGKGAEYFGLAGLAIWPNPDRDGPETDPGSIAFNRLREGRTPDGKEKLTVRDSKGRANGAGPVRFFDFQVGAPKSVSVLGVVMADERLREAHEKAARKAFGELERFAARRRYRDEPELTGNLVAAAFTHDASRALDPQLHTHFVVANVTVGTDGRRYALTESEVVRAIRYCGKVYQSELARECRKLGYALVDKRNEKGVMEGWEIAGVSQDVLKRFSKRRAAVEAGIAAFRQEHGREPTTAEVSIIARESRAEKAPPEVTTEMVRKAQLEQLSETERSQLSGLVAEASATQVETVEKASAKTAIAEAREHLFERRSVCKEHEVLAEALNGQWGRLTVEEVKAAFSQDTNLLELDQGEERLNRVVGTVEGLRQEQWAIEHVDRQKGKFDALGRLEFEPAEFLSAEQKNVVSRLTRSTDGVVSFVGVAGAGKTTTLKELDRALGEAGRNRLYLAPTNGAKDVLKSEGFENAMTVEMYLVRPPLLERGSVVVVDEAGLLSNRAGVALLKEAERQGARVVLLGDARQHSSVEAGDFLRVLETYSNIEKVELREVRRQKKEEYREAVKWMAGGQVAAGMARLDELGMVRELKGDYLEAAATEFLRVSENGKALTVRKGKEEVVNVLAVAPTHEEGKVLTEKIRAGLKKAGQLGAATELRTVESFGWTVQQKQSVEQLQMGLGVVFTTGPERGRFYEVAGVDHAKKTVTLKNVLGVEKKIRLSKKTVSTMDIGRVRKLEVAEGDRVMVTVNDREEGLVNGQLLTVQGVHGSEIVLEGGKHLPKDFGGLTYGYVTTSHKSQGKTCDHVVVAAARLDGKAAYVSTSRGRESCVVFTPDKEQLMGGLKNSGERLAAIDALKAARERRCGKAINGRETVWKRWRNKAVKVGKSLARLVREQRRVFRYQWVRLMTRKRNQVVQ